MSALGLFEKSTYGDGNRLIYSRVRVHENMASCNPNFSLKFVVEGTENYVLNNKHYNVGNGQYILVNPGNVHQEYVQSSKEVSGICISLSEGMLNDVYRNLRSSSVTLLDNPIGHLKNPFDLYETLYGSGGCVLGNLLQQLSGNAGGAAMAQRDAFGFYSLVAQRLLEAQGLVQEKICLVRAEKYATQKELYRRVEAGKAYIAANYSRPLELEEIAASAAMSPFHFSRTFKQVQKVSPYQYVLAKRLEKAKMLLTAKQYNISEIAYLTGFPDIFTFSKTFKGAFQLTPSQFRALV